MKGAEPLHTGEREGRAPAEPEGERSREAMLRDQPGRGSSAGASPIPHSALRTPHSTLPRRLHAAVVRELYPGERVELVLRTKAAKGSRPWLGVGGTMGLAVVLAVGMMSIGAWVLGAIFGLEMLFLACLGWQASQNVAYVVTDQRCFRLGRFLGRAQVRELHGDPDGAELDREDRLELTRWVKALAARSPAADAPRGSESPVRKLPVELGQRLEQALRPGETLLWADRPMTREYLFGAPAGALVMTLVCLAACFLVAALFGIVAAGPAAATTGLPGFVWVCGATAVASGFGAAAALGRQIRRTIYAVTDRRGLVLSPDAKITSYTPRQLRDFLRLEGRGGRGTLAASDSAHAGFHGVRDVRAVDDLIKGRLARVRSTEVIPAGSVSGGTDQLVEPSEPADPPHAW